MNRILLEIIGIVGAFVDWWSMAVIFGIAMYAIWPSTDNTSMAGISLAPQNVPGNIIGFILALYAFRAVTWQGRAKRNE